jgi:hypothetical protein
MASELIKHISDASFEADVLQPGTTVLSITGPNGAAPAR